MTPSHDINETACQTILHFLRQSSDGNVLTRDQRITLLNDLCWRVQRLSDISKAVVLSQACYELLPEDVTRFITREQFDVRQALTDCEAGRRQRKDVGIVTVIRPELEAVLRVLGRSPSDAADDRPGATGYWFGTIQVSSGAHMSVVATMVGQPRNVPCANTVGQLLTTFDVGLIVLVGVAAGVREKTKLGDVVYAERVYDYEHVRREIPGWLWSLFRSGSPFGTVERQRPELWPVPDRIIEALERCDWEKTKPLYRQLVSSLDNLPDSSNHIAPAVHDGTIAAGEKLFADGSLQRMSHTFDERIRAGDQEDSVFGQASDFFQKPWCIFRGICDHGDPNKGGRWQAPAALAAAIAAHTFLSTVWFETSKKLAE